MESQNRKDCYSKAVDDVLVFVGVDLPLEKREKLTEAWMNEKKSLESLGLLIHEEDMSVYNEK